MRTHGSEDGQGETGEGEGMLRKVLYYIFPYTMVSVQGYPRTPVKDENV